MSVFLQLHAWVTAMSLQGKALPPWKTLEEHPADRVPVQTGKRPGTGSSKASKKKPALPPALGKPASPTASNETGS